MSRLLNLREAVLAVEDDSEVDVSDNEASDNDADDNDNVEVDMTTSIRIPVSFSYQNHSLQVCSRKW